MFKIPAKNVLKKKYVRDLQKALQRPNEVVTIEIVEIYVHCTGETPDGEINICHS